MRLLRIEFRKLLTYNTFRVLFTLFIFFLGIILFWGRNLPGSGGKLTSDKILGYPNIWNYYSFFACLFNIILGVLSIFIACNEYTYRTLRQNIIDGLSRNEAVIGKIYFYLVLSVVSTFFMFVFGLIAGHFYSSETTAAGPLDHASFVFAYWIQSIGIMAMGFFFATVFKKTGLAVIIFLLFLFPVDVILRAAFLRSPAGDYLPVANSFLKMAPFPITHVLSGGSELPPAFPSAIPLLVGAGYAILFFGMSWMITRKRDL